MHWPAATMFQLKCDTFPGRVTGRGKDRGWRGGALWSLTAKILTWPQPQFPRLAGLHSTAHLACGNRSSV